MLDPIELSMYAVINKLSLVWVSPCRVTILDDKNCPLYCMDLLEAKRKLIYRVIDSI